MYIHVKCSWISALEKDLQILLFSFLVASSSPSLWRDDLSILGEDTRQKCISGCSYIKLLNNEEERIGHKIINNSVVTLFFVNFLLYTQHGSFTYIQIASIHLVACK